MNLINTLIDKESSMDVGTGALYSVVAILMVFIILLVIIGVTTLVFKTTGLFEMKKQLDQVKKANETPVAVAQNAPAASEVNITDDDMMAAVLVATIDYRNEIKKDVKVVSVREIK